MKSIVILGGGFAGVEFYKTLHKKLHGAPDILFTLVSDKNYFLFYPMLHEVATGSVERNHITQPLREVVSCCRENFVQGLVTKINFNQRIVETSAGEVAYDYLVIGLGVESNFFGTPGAPEYCITMKSIADAVQVRNKTIRNFELATREHNVARRRELLSFLIIGGGATGVELAGQLADLINTELRELYQEIDYSEVSITLVNAGKRLLRQCNEMVSIIATDRLKKMGVKVLCDVSVASCQLDGVCLTNGQKLSGSLCAWTAGTQSVVRHLVDSQYVGERGGLKTTQTLQLVGHPEVFVVGDNLEITSPHPEFIPQLAQAATAAARCAAKNLWRAIRHQPAQAFVFRDRGQIIPIGDWFAVGQFGNKVYAGRLMWWLRRTVFIQNIWSLANRLKILVDWTLCIFRPRDTSEL